MIISLVLRIASQARQVVQIVEFERANAISAQTRLIEARTGVDSWLEQLPVAFFSCVHACGGDGPSLAC